MNETTAVIISSNEHETTVNISTLDCPDYDDEAMKMVDEFSFWIEGVTQTIIAILGICGNIVAGFILSRREMRNAFNLLLVTLACFDSTYLFGSILESFRKQFLLVSNVHIILFPYLLYPFNQMAITGSIFMTVAIALERYIAVHYPLDYSQAMHEANALTKRIVKYVSAVIFLSVVFTITRFFEADVIYKYTVDPSTNETLDYTAHLVPTELRTAPLYTMYFNWSRLIVLGIIPFIMLVYLNAKIYKDIKARRIRRLGARGRSGVTNGHNGGEPTTMTTTVRNVDLKINGGKVLNVIEKNGNHEAIELTKPVNTTTSTPTEQQKLCPSPKPTHPPPPSIAVNESRRKKEDNMAVIFMGFILVFLVCHLPRLLLNIHELATIRHAMECQEAGEKPFPLWSQIAISISHVLLVVNSSTNIFIYCFLSSKFRAECAKLYQSICRKLCFY